MLSKEEKVACLVYVMGVLMGRIALLEGGEEAEDEALAHLDVHWNEQLTEAGRNQINKMEIGKFLRDFEG